MNTNQANRRLLHLAAALGATAVAAYSISKLLTRNTTRGKKDEKDEDGEDEDNYPINLGTYTFPHQTTSMKCQRWCDRAWVWVHGFHRQEAAECFQQAIQADSNCAMAHYGLALANGPDYNFTAKGGFYALAATKDGYPSLNVAVNALTQALRITSSKHWNGPPQHRALMQALSLRYEWPVTSTTVNKQVDYRDAMRDVAETYPKDPEVQAIYAESVMCLSPWDLYDNQRTNPTPNQYGLECSAALNRGLQSSPQHYWLCHLKVHFNEMGHVADFDWKAANALRNSGTHEVGHLLHMPTHLDIQVGNYEKAIVWNMKAYQADLKLLQAFPNKKLVLYTGYLIHNMEFCAWAAMYGGYYERAMEAIAGIDAVITDDILRGSERAAQRLELYRATRIMALIRFGKWDDLLKLSFRKDREVFLSHTLFLHYGRGIAFGVQGDVASAKQEQRAFLGMTKTLNEEDRIKHNVHIVDMANIAKDVLAGEICYRERNYDEAYVLLRRAVQSFDRLPYDEPHGWLMSPRHTLGALLTEQTHYQEAMVIYEEDLNEFPMNPWSLRGLQTCYDGLGFVEKSLQNEKLLKKAQASCDISIGASCACALKDWEEK